MLIATGLKRSDTTKVGESGEMVVWMETVAQDGLFMELSQ
jgi:hypothetical protein